MLFEIVLSDQTLLATPSFPWSLPQITILISHDQPPSGLVAQMVEQR